MTGGGALAVASKGGAARSPGRRALLPRPVTGACCLALLLVGCDAAPESGPAPFVNAADLLEWPEVRDCRNSIEHDSNHIRVLASPDTKDAYLAFAGSFPEGAIVVKPEYADPGCTDLVRVTVMRKGAALDPDLQSSGGWAWQELTPDLSVIESGALGRCSSCHSSCDGGRGGVCAQP